MKAQSNNLPIHSFKSVIVGDSTVDMQLGRSARFHMAVGVLSGSCTHDELAPLADVVMGTAQGLHEALMTKGEMLRKDYERLLTAQEATA